MGSKHPYGYRNGCRVLGTCGLLGRLDFFKEIWIEPEKYTTQMICILVAFVALLLYIMIAARKKKTHE